MGWEIRLGLNGGHNPVGVGSVLGAVTPGRRWRANLGLEAAIPLGLPHRDRYARIVTPGSLRQDRYARIAGPALAHRHCRARFAGRESQRDSVPQPRVARHEPPWVTGRPPCSTPTGLWLSRAGHHRACFKQVPNGDSANRFATPSRSVPSGCQWPDTGDGVGYFEEVLFR